jgi:hypothetical protein
MGGLWCLPCNDFLLWRGFETSLLAFSVKCCFVFVRDLWFYYITGERKFDNCTLEVNCRFHLILFLNCLRVKVYFQSLSNVLVFRDNYTIHTSYLDQTLLVKCQVWIVLLFSTIGCIFSFFLLLCCCFSFFLLCIFSIT